jgi:competence protein ComEC
VTATAIPAASSRAPFDALGRALDWLRREAVAERERWPLFAPVAIGIGVGCYFGLPVEPPLWPLAAIAAAGAAMALGGLFAARGTLARIGPELALAGLAVALVGGGMAAAKLRAETVAAPVLEKRIGPVMISGRVDSVEDRAEGRRVVLSRVAIPGMAPAATPANVRISLRDREPALPAGQWTRVLAILNPPPAPAAPGAYDFQREAYFEGLGAVGFAIGVPKDAAPPGGEASPASIVDRFSLGLAQLRYDITARVQRGIGGAEGAVAAALMTGEQDAIPGGVIADMRNSGLAHLLAVSGFNFVLIAGMLFFLVRALLALIPPLALRYPTKKWAAGVALVGGVAYFAITGDSIATERAFIMVSLVFIAVIVDRSPISMRTLAWAATLVLLLQPESLLGASFQLSFAAVTALIAFYEDWGSSKLDSAMRGEGDAGGGQRWLRIGTAYFIGIALTTLIASTATAPLLVYHFNRFATLSVIANLVAVPLTAVWIMPWALLAFVLMPFGLDQIALVPMGWGVHGLIWIAHIASAPHFAVWTLPAMPAAGIITIVAGGLWLCLWRRLWRYAGLAAAAAGLFLWAFARPPDILVDGDAGLVAVRAADDRMILSSERTAKLHADTWLRRAGQSDALPWPRGTSPDGSLTCDSQGCIFRARGQVASIAMSEAAAAEDCGSVGVLVSLVPVRGRCSARVVDRFDLWRRGSYAIWLDPGGIRIASVREWQGRRPWAPERRRKITTTEKARE